MQRLKNPEQKKYPKDTKVQQKHAAISFHRKRYFNLKIQTAAFSPLLQSEMPLDSYRALINIIWYYMYFRIVLLYFKVETLSTERECRLWITAFCHTSPPPRIQQHSLVCHPWDPEHFIQSERHFIVIADITSTCNVPLPTYGSLPGWETFLKNSQIGYRMVDVNCYFMVMRHCACRLLG